MPSIFAIVNGLLQGNLDADGFTILNLDLTGLGLTKASVGLGNVDNTSDINKPLSTATATALGLKEPVIAPGTTSQFLIGDKTWLDFGDLALESGVTSLPIISTVGASAASNAVLAVNRNDSVAAVRMSQLGASVVGNVLTGLPGANVGMLSFEADSLAVIRTTNAAPIIFGVNNTKRMRLEQGLNVGGDADPGAGCITAFGTITGGFLAGDGSLITGIVKNQIPGTLNATIMPNLLINGVGGNGYIRLGAQSSNPAQSTAHLFATSGGRVALGHSGSTAHPIVFDNGALTAEQTYGMPNWTGTLESRVAVPASAAAAGVAGQVAYDASFEYRCISSGVWVRNSHATW